MGDKWIVSDHRFYEHKSARSALTERDRLRALHPEKKFRVHRIKTTLQQSNSGPYIRELEARIKMLEIEREALVTVSLRTVMDGALKEFDARRNLVGELAAAKARIAELEVSFRLIAASDAEHERPELTGPCACFPHWPDVRPEDQSDKPDPCACFPSTQDEAA